MLVKLFGFDFSKGRGVLKTTLHGIDLEGGFMANNHLKLIVISIFIVLKH